MRFSFGAISDDARWLCILCLFIGSTGVDSAGDWRILVTLCVPDTSEASLSFVTQGVRFEIDTSRLLARITQTRLNAVVTLLDTRSPFDPLWLFLIRSLRHVEFFYSFFC